MTEENSLQQLAEQLARATNSGHAKWTKSGHAAYLTTIGGYSVLIRSVDDDGQPPFRMTLLDENSVEVASLDWQSVRTAYETVAQSPDNDYLTALYESARNSVVSVDSVVGAILALLQETAPGTTKGAFKEEE